MTSLVVVPVAGLAMISMTHLTDDGVDRPAVPHAEAFPPRRGDIDAATFRRIAQEQMPTVVSLRIVSEIDVPAMDLLGSDQFPQFFGVPSRPRMPSIEDAGSGFIIDPSGLILTNRHVIHDARRIEVTFLPDPAESPGTVRHLDAKVLGRDPVTDTALLQLLEARNLPVARIGDSNTLKPGDWVMAIGNPFTLSHTVTVGVISATSRSISIEGRELNVLQTDAAVNPGNSGGPLLNLRGEVVGITTAFLHAGTAGNVGVGFAVPINLVRDSIDDLRHGEVRRGWLGVEFRPVPEGARSKLGLDPTGGVLVVTVDPDGPAHQADLRPGDVILELNGESQHSAQQLFWTVSRLSPGSEATVVVLRGKSRRQLTVTIGEQDGPAGAGSLE